MDTSTAPPARCVRWAGCCEVVHCIFGIVLLASTITGIIYLAFRKKNGFSNNHT